MTMTETRDVLPAAPGDRDRCTATMVAAFVNDPLMRWMFPAADQYLAVFPQVIRHYGGTAFDLGTAFRTDDSAGCACWLAPGEAVDEVRSRIEGLLRDVRRGLADAQDRPKDAVG